MEHKIKITDVIFDFDGTCTQIPAVYENYLESYYAGLVTYMKTLNQSVPPAEWQAALKKVHAGSPHRAWTLLSRGSAPASADPYITAGEAANIIYASHGVPAPPQTVNLHGDAYNAYIAPWRTDAGHTVLQLLAKGVKVHFISNSATDYIQKRLTYLLLNRESDVTLYGNASKFKETDPTDELSQDAKKLYSKLPKDYPSEGLEMLGRDVFVRRGAFFDKIYEALDKDISRINTTLFVGDVWELDLAMPYLLGGNIHLITRAAPFNTYEYERKIVESYGDRGRISDELSGILEWFNMPKQ